MRCARPCSAHAVRDFQDGEALPPHLRTIRIAVPGLWKRWRYRCAESLAICTGYCLSLGYYSMESNFIVRPLVIGVGSTES
jgi:hypothetical protein